MFAVCAGLAVFGTRPRIPIPQRLPNPSDEESRSPFLERKYIIRLLRSPLMILMVRWLPTLSMHRLIIITVCSYLLPIHRIFSSQLLRLDILPVHPSIFRGRFHHHTRAPEHLFGGNLYGLRENQRFLPLSSRYPLEQSRRNPFGSSALGIRFQGFNFVCVCIAIWRCRMSRSASHIFYQYN